MIWFLTQFDSPPQCYIISAEWLKFHPFLTQSFKIVGIWCVICMGCFMALLHPFLSVTAPVLIHFKKSHMGFEKHEDV